MYKIFGNKDNFAIEYKLDSSFENSTYAYIRVWIEGIDICEYNQNQKCECDLYPILEWFCEKIEFILGYDAFPLPIEGNTSLELIEKADKYEDDNMLEFDLWYAAKSRWVFNHCWFSVRDGAVLPSVYFRRIKENIEISWDNIFWERNNIIFNSKRGIYLVKFEIFISILKEFLFSAIKDLENKIDNKEGINIMKKQLMILDENK